MIKLIVDRKIVTWIRTEVEVEANSMKEAVGKYNGSALQGCKIISAKEIEGVRRPISLKENHHQPTLEIYSPDKPGELWNNKNGHYIK